MTQSNPPGAAQAANLQLSGGAAIVAPVSAFPGGVPGNAMVVLPLSEPSDDLKAKLEAGPMALTPEQMWELLGFNGPAVQVQDNQGRPIAIGLEDLLGGLEKHWKENKDDLNRGRIYAQELMKYARVEKAEKVLARIVASGGTGEDWLGLGVAQLQQDKWEKAEATLKGAQKLLETNPFPTLHLAKVYKGKGDSALERKTIEKALEIDPKCVDAWAYLYTHVKDQKDEAEATKVLEALAEKGENAKTAAPYIAVQGFYANNEDTLDEAFLWAEKAVKRSPNDPLALVCLSALHGQRGRLDEVIKLLQPHEGKMSRDVRLANNYFEALFQARQIDKVTKLLNALAGSPSKEVKQFAIERSRQVAQYLQQQQAAGQGQGQAQAQPKGS